MPPSMNQISGNSISNTNTNSSISSSININCDTLAASSNPLYEPTSDFAAAVIGKKKQIGRDAAIDYTNCVIRIQTNKKTVWQHTLK